MGELFEWGYQILLCLVFKSSLHVCITSFPFASTKEQQQEILKPNGKGTALT